MTPVLDALDLAARVHGWLADDGDDDPLAAAVRLEVGGGANVLDALALAGDVAMQRSSAIVVLPESERPAGAGAGIDEDGPGQPLAGWVPPGADRPLSYAGGRLTQVPELRQGGKAWWADDYTLTVWLPHGG